MTEKFPGKDLDNFLEMRLKMMKNIEDLITVYCVIIYTYVQTFINQHKYIDLV